MENPDFLGSELLQNPINKAVIVLFPDIRTVDGVRQEAIDLGIRPVVDFKNTTYNVLAMYRRNGFKQFAVTYKDTYESNQWSPLYPNPSLFDGIVTLPMNMDEWTRQKYLDQMATIETSMNLTRMANVFVGGYHAEDCVAQMTAFLRRNGHRATADLRLTDKLPNLLYIHRSREMLGFPDKEERGNNFQIWEYEKRRIEEKIAGILQEYS